MKQAFPQNNCITNNWNWWSDNTQNNWTFKSAEKNEVDWMGSIWTGPSRNLLSVNRIIMSEDYTPRNGWVLLYKDFGCNGGSDHPYFILHNKYRGKLRLFMLLYNFNFGNGGVATLRWTDGNKTTSLLTHSSGISRANHNYHERTPISSDVSTSASNSYYSDKWFVADFDVAFDHLTPITERDYQLSIDVSAIEKTEVEMTGTLDWITEPYSPNVSSSNIIETTSEGKTVKDYLTDAKKITKNIPSESDLKKVFGDNKQTLVDYQSNTNISFGNSIISERYQLKMEQLSEGSGFSNFLTGVSKYGPVVGQYIDVAIGVFDFLSSKPNAGPQQVVVMPTVTHGSVSLSGTLTTQMPIDIITMGLPGTIQSNDLYKPYYNCPLGVIGLEKEPSLSIRKWTESAIFYSMTKKRDDNSEYVLRTSTGKNNYKSIRIDDDIKIALNALANAEVISVKAALCGRIRGKVSDNTKPAYPFTIADTYKEFYKFPDNYKVSNPYIFKWTKYLDDNFYHLTSIDGDGFAEFSTPFVDIQNFKGVSFTVREETDVYLQIFATLKTNNTEASSSPIVFSAKYMLTEPLAEADNIDTPYPFSQAQLSDLDILDNSSNKTVLNESYISSGTYKNWDISTKGNIVADAKKENVAINAYNKIVLSPGFSATPTGNYSVSIGIIKESMVIPSNYNDISNLVTTYFSDCISSSLKSASLVNENSYATLIKDAENSINPNIYPNPTSGIINIEGLPLNAERMTEIHVFDIMGKVVFSDNTSSTNYRFDLSNQNRGIYMVKLSNGSNFKMFKIIKN
jgi:hypothetical protein